MENRDLQGLFRTLLDVRSKFDENLEALAQQMNVNKSELLVLLDVMDHPSTSLSDVCRRNGLKKSAASKLVDRLIEREFMTRDVCPTSRREVVLNIGQGFGKETFCRRQAMSAIFPNHPDSDLEKVDDMIDSVNKIKRIL